MRFLSQKQNHSGETPIVQKRISKDEYIEIIQSILQHILRGDCYEINFCQEFFAENADLDPLDLYQASEPDFTQPVFCILQSG